MKKISDSYLFSYGEKVDNILKEIMCKCDFLVNSVGAHQQEDISKEYKITYISFEFRLEGIKEDIEFVESQFKKCEETFQESGLLFSM